MIGLYQYTVFDYRRENLIHTQVLRLDVHIADV